MPQQSSGQTLASTRARRSLSACTATVQAATATSATTSGPSARRRLSVVRPLARLSGWARIGSNAPLLYSARGDGDRRRGGWSLRSQPSLATRLAEPRPVMSQSLETTKRAPWKDRGSFLAPGCSRAHEGRGRYVDSEAVSRGESSLITPLPRALIPCLRPVYLFYPPQFSGT